MEFAEHSDEWMRGWYAGYGIEPREVCRLTPVDQAEYDSGYECGVSDSCGEQRMNG